MTPSPAPINAVATTDLLGKVVESIANRFDDDLYKCSQNDLERYWHFKWDANADLPTNLYQFHMMLELYGSSCRRWENHHHGHVCIVGRVRDKYLMPKIQEFVARVEDLPNEKVTDDCPQ